MGDAAHANAVSSTSTSVSSASTSATTQWYRVTHTRIWVRAAPSMSAQKLGCLNHRDVVAVTSVTASSERWVRLHEFEHNFLHATPTQGAYALVDGTSLGLGVLLEPIHERSAPPPELWSLPHRLLSQLALSSTTVKPRAPVRIRDYGGEAWPHVLAPASDAYLSYWRADERREVAQPVGYHGETAADWVTRAPARSSPPRLAIALLLRGAPPASVANFLRYHLAIGFERVYLCFDDPSELAAISAARPYASRGAVLLLMSEAFWEAERASGTNDFFTSTDPERVEYRRHFASGDVQVCVTCHDLP